MLDQRLQQPPTHAAAMPHGQAALRSVTAVDVALDALGAGLAQLHGEGELNYLDAKLLTLQDAAAVRGVLQGHGRGAFVEEGPDENFGLGTVYPMVRAALRDAGVLGADTPAVVRGLREPKLPATLTRATGRWKL